MANTAQPATTDSQDKTPSRMLQLARTILSETEFLDNCHQNCPAIDPPTFGPDGKATRDELGRYEEARAKIEEATLELHDLSKHPADIVTVRPEICAARAFIGKFKIADKVPLGGSISYGTLAGMISVELGAVESLCRLAIAHRIFSEPENGRLSHSPASLLLRDQAQDALRKKFNDDYLPTTAYIIKALEQYPEAKDHTQSAAALLNVTNGNSTYLQNIKQYTARDMDIHPKPILRGQLSGMSFEHVANGYNWRSIPASSWCVDLGGGHAEAAMAVFRKHPHFNWWTQRSPHGDESIEPQDHDQANVAHMDWDYFRPQPEGMRKLKVKLFLLRRVLHNWSDEYCARILKALIPSLEKGTIILIMERLLKRPGDMPNTLERALRSQDVRQLALRNGKERDKTQWRRVFAGADNTLRRFQVQRFIEPPGSDLAFIEVVWKG